MIRLLLLLVLGIGAAMYYADEIAGVNRRDQSAQVVAAPEREPETAPEAQVVLTSLDAEPAVTEARPAPTLQAPTDAANMVPFMHPAVIGADGRIVPVTAKPERVETTAPDEPEEPRIPVLYVSAERVNVRDGPSTSDPVIGSVDFAEAVQILSDPAEDWVLIRIEGDGIEGFMSSRYLTESDPGG